MMDIKDFRKLKIVFLKEDGSYLSLEEVERLIENSQDLQKKWFLRGIKHILENHYTEAIKRFQLVDDGDARLLILSCAYKIQDRYIFDEYKNSFAENGKLLKILGIKPYFLYEESLVGLENVLSEFKF